MAMPFSVAKLAKINQKVKRLAYIFDGEMVNLFHFLRLGKNCT